MRKLLTVFEVGLMTGLTRQRIHQLIDAGRFKVAFKSPRLLLLSKASVDAYLFHKMERLAKSRANSKKVK